MTTSLELIEMVEGEVELRRYEDRYYVDHQGVTLGWVVRAGRSRRWSAFLRRDLNGSTQSAASQAATPSVFVGQCFRARSEAVSELVAVAVIRHLYAWGER